MRVSGWMTGWLFLAAAARAQSVDEWLANFPAHTAAPSGELDLPVASACLLRVDGKETRRVDGRLSILTVEDGVVTGWEAEAGRLAWNLDIPSNGTYRVTAFLAPQPARDCTLMLSFMREGKETRLNASFVDADVRRRDFPASDNPLLTSGATKSVGEVKLTQGRYHLLCRPSQWEHPFEMAPLAGFRLTAKGNPESPAPLALPAQPPPPFDAGPPATLFPTGGLDSLPQQRASPSGKTTMLSASPMVLPPRESVPQSPPTPFELRDQPAQLRELALRLQAHLVEAAPGLEAFRAAMDAQDWPGALRAYRDAFFSRLKHPESQGALTENILKEHLPARGKGFLLKRPHPIFLAANKQGSPVANVRGETLVSPPAKPGHTPWVPHARPPEGAAYGRGPDSHSFWKTEAGLDLARQIELCRMKKFLPADSDMFLDGGLFPALLYAYAVDGDREALAIWCAYLDDFVMRAVNQYAHYPISIRAATELEPQQFRALLMLWRIILDERPEFARDFDPAALARFLLFAIKEYPAYTIRAKRAQLANWGIMGLCDLAHLCRFFPEFRVMRYVEKETWRLWQANFFQHRTPDGENAEAWDTGHNAVDIEYARFAERLMPPPWALPEEGADHLDQIRVNQRSLLTHLTPDGQYWPAWLPEGRDLENDVRTRWLRNGWLDLIRHEPGARRRIDQTLAGRPGPLGPPERRSDYAPYAAMAYLRDGWAPEDAMWIFQNFQTRSQELSTCGNTAALLCKSGRILAEIHPLAVNGKPPNRFLGNVPSGGKTDYGGEASGGHAGGLMRSTDLCQFAQGNQYDPYAIPAKSERSDVTGLYQGTPDGRDDPSPITQLRPVRRMFMLPDGLTLICDRLDSQTNAVHEYSQFINLPALPAVSKLESRVPEWRQSGNPLVWLDSEKGEAGTRLPGLNNVVVSFFGPGKPVLANRLNRKREHERSTATPLEALEKALQGKKDAKWVGENLDRFPVSARWTAGEELVTALAVRTLAPGQDKSAWTVSRLDTPAPALGLLARHPDGTTAHLLQRPVRGAMPLGTQRVQFAGVETDAEGILVIEKSGDRQIWLFSAHSKSQRLHGKDVALAWPDVLVETNQGVVTQTPLRRPREVSIGGTPDAGDSFDPEPVASNRPVEREEGRHLVEMPNLNKFSVFTDSISVDMADLGSGSDIHYTLDGTEPTLESPKYGKPFMLSKTTLVKARPFARGLNETPWHFDGVTVGKTRSVVFEKKPWKGAHPVDVPSLRPGLTYEYMEGDWTSIFLLTGEPGLLPVKKRGVVRALLDDAEIAAIRETDGAYGLRCEGWMRAAKEGLYTFHAPEPLFSTTLDAGYDLRIWVDGEEWSPCPRPHARDTWTVPLRAGWHRVRVAFADYREKPFRNDYWMPWRPEQMASGAPILEVEGPEGPKGAPEWAHEKGEDQ